MIPCHCIIGHPEKAKFLVIKHENGWSPPQVQVPGDGPLMYRPATINQGIMQKYGLRTTVLRTILSSQNYHCLELEMHASSPREMQAVWMDRENYDQFSRQDSGGQDPFELWLAERESGDTPPLRSPWERPGWYQIAEQWMTRQLVELDIQTTGSIQQFKAGWPVSCLLRVATVQGQVYLKAAYAKPPGEAQITAELARRWPEIVPRPISIDTDRNWMLMRDFEMKKANRAQVQHYPDFAATLARLQVGSMAELDAWRELACPVMDLDYLQDTQGEAAKLFASVEPRLGSGKDALSAEEISQLAGAMEAGRKDCKKLAEYGISSSLAHLDFRPDNWFFEDQKCRIMDWSDVAITHPFMSLCQLLDFLDEHGTGTPGEEDSAPVNEEMKQAIARSYLEIFAEQEGAGKTEEAMQAARAVFPLFSLYCVAFELQHVAAQGPKDRELRNTLKQRARALIAG